MIRLYLSYPIHANKPIALTEEQYHYLHHVMRLSSFDKILCFNGSDGEWEAILTECGKKKWNAIPQKHTRKQNKAPFCALCPALIKKDNFDLVLQKATELNVSDIYPLKLERCVIPTLNMKRAESILIEAAEQSERLSLPHLHPVMSLSDFLKNLPKDSDLYCLYERAPDASVKTIGKKPLFVVGPEGGFTAEELN